MTISEYLQTNMLCDDALLDTEDYVVYSSEFQNHLSEYVMDHYGSLNFRRYFKNMPAPGIKIALTTLYETNRYKYTGLYEATKFTYNPIENYNMVEQSTDTSQNTTSSTITTGAQENTSSSTRSTSGSMITGEQTNSDEINGSGSNQTLEGAHQDVLQKDTEIGSQTTSGTRKMEYGEQEISTEDTNQVSPYNSYSTESFVNESKKIGSQINSLHEDNETTTGSTSTRNDSDTSTNAYGSKETNINTTNDSSESHTIGSRTDTTTGSDTGSDVQTLGSRTDTGEGSEDNTTNHNLTRSGNIGVTTTQQMITSQREVLDYNFTSVVAKDIIKLLAVRIYDFDEED